MSPAYNTDNDKKLAAKEFHMKDDPPREQDAVADILMLLEEEIVLDQALNGANLE